MPRRREISPLTDGQRQLVEVNLGLVFDLVKKYGPGLRDRSPFLDLEDFNSLGSLGLVDADTKYNPSFGVPFGTYAARRILGAMLDGSRKANGNYRKDNPTNIAFVSIFHKDDAVEDPFLENIKDRSTD